MQNARTSLLVRLCLTWALLAGAFDAAARGQCADWSPAVNLSSDSGRYAVDGHVAIDSVGNVHVIYQSFLDTSGRNYYTTNAGGSWSAPVNVGSMGGKGSTPRIVITPDQRLHVFYGKDEIYHRSKPVNGGTWSGSTLLAQGSFINNAVVDSAGGIHFVYGQLFSSRTPRNGIWSRYLPLGGNWGGDELVYGNSDDSNWPKASAVAARGNVLWCGIEVNKRIYLKKRPPGGPWPAGLGMELHNTGAAVQLAFNPIANEVAALYHESLGGDENTPWFEIFARFSYDDGATWTSPLNISDLTRDIDRSPQIAYDANGNLHVVWEGFCCDHKSRVRYRGRIGGHWTGIQTLMPSAITGGIVTEALRTHGTTVWLTYGATGQGAIGNYDVFIRSMNPDQPLIQVAPTSLSRTLWVHETLTDETFTIVNGCPGTLNYTIEVDADWIEIAPVSGSSTTNQEVITISYPGVSRLRAGTYAQTITVSGNALNSPVIIPLTVVVQTVPPDLDGDEDVDQEDFAILQNCYTGPYVPQTDPACRNARIDGDDDVDADDAEVFLRCISGADVPAVRTCAE
ncbi:MAG TPA: hypothetical protein PL151_19745 [Phycisphaerae bacterium]|nr:hypothetical protein [Phycisphaerae bacterium]HOJ74200.1 hypothetical protein [Phycisphaerae bacterium]HOM51278.1 hypothetical protein [Phycisphaerae bacterium]HON68656.1 hypothetical protein [Phycisphaerae bacterium]HOQ84890.1 hypothetical protein [Phycisphaerae bacterium]